MNENKNKKIEFDYDKGGEAATGHFERRTLFVTDVSEGLIKGIDIDQHLLFVELLLPI